MGIDGSKSMMVGAEKTGLYRDLKLCVLGEQDLPVEKGFGALFSYFIFFI